MTRRRKTRVCIYGCGAIGSLLAWRLVRAGADVSVIARGPQLTALREHGLQLTDLAGNPQPPVRVAATYDPAELGEQAIVFLTLKSHSLPAIAGQLAPLLERNTAVVTAANGFPWWYFHGLAAPAGRKHLAAVDPGGALWRAIGPERAVGCIVYPAATLAAPGRVRHVFGNRLTLGAPAGGDDARLADLAGLLERAEFAVQVAADIRPELWAKLMANAAYNPVSVITGKTLGDMLDDPGTRGLLVSIMGEVAALAAALGVAPAMTPEELLAASRPFGEHRTSMLQDVQAGREPEAGPVVDALLELAGFTGVALPALGMARDLLASKLGGLS